MSNLVIFPNQGAPRIGKFMDAIRAEIHKPEHELMTALEMIGVLEWLKIEIIDGLKNT